MESFKTSLVILAVCYSLVSANQPGGSPKPGVGGNSTSDPRSSTSDVGNFTIGGGVTDGYGGGHRPGHWMDYFDYNMQEEFNGFLMEALDDITPIPGRTIEFCPFGTVYCVEAAKCIRAGSDEQDCSDKDAPYKGDKRTFMDSLKDELAELSKEDELTKFCDFGMIWCIDTRRCVPVNCKEEECGYWNNWCSDGCDESNNYCKEREYTIDDFKDSLRREAELLAEDAGRTEYCEYPMTYCFQAGRCVPMECTVERESLGSCPAVTTAVCRGVIECHSDADCQGLKSKCCQLGCGDSVCSAPDLSALDPDDITVKPYLVAFWKVDLEPAGVVVNTDFIKTGADTGYVKFSVSNARGRCLWKYASDFNTITLDNGNQEQVPVWANITDDTEVAVDELVTCIPANLSVHGLAVVNVTQFDQNGAEVETHIFAALLLPTKVEPIIELDIEGVDSEVRNSTLELMEDVEVVVNIPVKVSFPMEFTFPEFTTDDTIGLLGNERLFDAYTKQLANGLERTSSPGLFMRYTEKPATREDMPGALIFADDKKPGEFKSVSYNDGAFIKLNQDVIFVPAPDFSGSFDIEVYAWDGVAPARQSPFVSSSAIEFTVNVVAVNDAPQMKIETVTDLSFSNFKDAGVTLEVPLDVNENPENLVSDVIKDFFTDAETDTLGMCVLRATQSALGEFMYKSAGSNNWVTADVDEVSDKFAGGQFLHYDPSGLAELADVKNYRELLQAVRTDQQISRRATDSLFGAQCLLLAPDTLIKFQPASGDTFWKYREAPQFAFTAWDTAGDQVNQEGQLLNYTLPFCTECASDDSVLALGYIVGHVMRLDCSNRVSQTRVVNDVCGECGGDNSTCIDCAGDLNGQAEPNRCGHCAGGTTGVNVTFGLDCNERCSENRVKVFAELDNACLPIDTNATAIIGKLFCDNVWKSGAKLDRCGTCVGGTTGKVRNGDMDACGVCFGDNSTCTDCDGTPRGTKVVDPCGNCLEPTDSSFGTGCVSISKFLPEIVIENTQGELKLTGAGLAQFTDPPACFFTLNNQEVPLTVQEFKNGVITAEYPSLSAAVYGVKCVFQNSQGADVELVVDSKTFTYVGVPTLTSIVPNTAEIGAIPQETYVVGSGFSDTGYVKCVFVCPKIFTGACKFGPIVLEAEYKNSTHVRCIIPAGVSRGIKFGLNLNISVAFTDVSDAPASEIQQYPSVQFSITSPPPEIESASFRGACDVVISFSTSIEFEEGDCKTGLNSAALNLLGTEFGCLKRGRFLIYNLGTNPTIRAGDSINLNGNKIKQLGAENAQYASGSVQVTGPSEPSVKFNRIRGPKTIGSCDVQQIRASFQGASCGTLEYKWNVSYAGNDPDAVALNLQDMITRLANVNSPDLEIAESEILPGEEYTFEVYVIDHLGEASDVQTKKIKRDSSVKPLLLDIGEDILNWNPDRNLPLIAKVDISECANVSLTNLEYRWSADGVTDFSFDGYNGYRAKIKKGSMRGGKTYAIQLTVSSPSDASIVAEASKTITTRSQSLVAYIDTPAVTGVGQELVLDGSLSSDPDRSRDEMVYLWSCSKLNDDGTDSGDPCYLSLYGQVQRFEVQSLTGAGERPKVTVPANAFESGGYRIELTVRKGDRSSTTSADVQVEEGEPPRLRITKIDSTITANRLFGLKATVTSTLPVRVGWRFDVDQGFEDFELTEQNSISAYETTKAVQNSPVPLVILPDSLKEGATYKVILSAEHDDSAAEATYEFTVNAPPQKCKLELSATSGEAVSDEFTVTVSGCEDDEDDFPLRFIFFAQDVATGERRRLTTSASDADQYTTTLAKGLQKFLGRICDQNGACVNVESDSINVTAAVLTSEKIDDIKAKIELQRLTGGSSNAANAFIEEALSASGDSATDDQKQAALEIAAAEGASQIVGANTDDGETAVEQLGGANELYKKADNVVVNGTSQKALDSDNAKLLNAAGKDTAANLIKGETSVDREESARKKRATAEESISAIDIATAEDLVSIAVTATKDILEADLTQSDANSYFSILESAWQGLCAGLVSGQDAVVGYTVTTVFRAHSTQLDGFDSTSLLASCTGCDQYVDTPATYTLGSEIVSTYGEWTCDTDTTCYGGCLATGQITQDLITATTTKIETLSSTRYSDIVAIHLINPTTSAYITVEELNTPITFNITLTSAPDTDTYKYMCRAWNSTDLDWTDSSCGEATVTNISSTEWVAACACNQLGYFAIFEGDEVVDQLALLETTPNPILVTEQNTTTMNATTTTTITNSTTANLDLTTTANAATANATTADTTTASSYLFTHSGLTAIKVVFSIDADYSVVSGGNESVIVEEIRAQLAVIMNVPANRITEIKLTNGSIVVEFQLLSDGNAAAMAAAVDTLESSVNSQATFTVGGTPYQSIAGSFTATAVAPVSSSTPGTAGGLGQGAIIGIAVGASLFVILIVIIIAAVVVIKKSKSNKVTHSPAGSRVVLQGYQNKGEALESGYGLKDTELPESAHIPAHKNAPDDEAMYGKAPTPVQPENHPISSRAENRTMTPVEP